MISILLSSIKQEENKVILVKETIIYFNGEGTEESPYLINNNLEFLKFGELVNNGNEFRNKYFMQTKDLDLEGIEQFIPIGKYSSNHYFYGVYNGAGHRIYNLNINGENTNVALFGQLGGIVKNLGIENGLIEGSCIGSIASHAVGNEAKIINCYNKANLIASGRAGGIADNFGQGKIINCWNEGNIEAPETGGVCSYTASTIYNSYCIQGNLFNEHFSGIMSLSTGGYNQSMSILAEKMNSGMQSSIPAFGLKEDSLTSWEVEKETITFTKREESYQAK